MKNQDIHNDSNLSGVDLLRKKQKKSTMLVAQPAKVKGVENKSKKQELEEAKKSMKIMQKKTPVEEKNLAGVELLKKKQETKNQQVSVPVVNKKTKPAPSEPVKSISQLMGKKEEQDRPRSIFEKPVEPKKPVLSAIEQQKKKKTVLAEPIVQAARTPGTVKKQAPSQINRQAVQPKVSSVSQMNKQTSGTMSQTGHSKAGTAGQINQAKSGMASQAKSGTAGQMSQTQPKAGAAVQTAQAQKKAGAAVQTAQAQPKAGAAVQKAQAQPKAGAAVQAAQAQKKASTAVQTAQAQKKAGTAVQKAQAQPKAATTDKAAQSETKKAADAKDELQGQDEKPRYKVIATKAAAWCIVKGRKIKKLIWDIPPETEGDEEGKKKIRLSGEAKRMIVFAAVAIFIFAGIQMLMKLNDYKVAREQYEKLADNVTKQKKSGKKQKFEVDFDALKAINSEVIGWIRFDDPDVINYPIVKGEDNTYYLNHTVEGTENNSGAVFMDYRNQADFGDYNTFVYGHNMRDNTMFALLRYYREEKFYKKNPYFYIYTADGKAYKYKIFSAYLVRETSDSYSMIYANEDAYKEYLNKITSRSMYDTGVKPTIEDSIISLSTCTYGNDTMRFLVHAKYVKD